MKSALRATLILSSSSLVSIIAGLVSAKVFAVLLGANGLGYMGLLQSLVGFAGLVAGVGLGTGLVRVGANALARDNPIRVAALRKAVWLLFWALGGSTMILMIIFRVPISRWMLGSPEHAGSVVLMSLALFFTLASGVQTSILNTYHRTSSLARYGILNSILGASISLVIVWRWGDPGIALAIIAGSVMSWCIATVILKKERIQTLAKVPRCETLEAVRSLLHFGGPYTLSMLVGTGIQLILPALILHTLGTESIGYYRAAVAISVNYLGFLLIAMGMDYYPRIASVSHEPTELVHLVNQQYRLVLLLAVPIVLATLALAPILVPLVYSPQFAPTVDILEWQLLGDLFKFASWTLGTVILARSKSPVIFIVELIAGINILTTSWLGMRWFGLQGLGIGFLITYMVHFIVVWMILRREIRMTWTPLNKRISLLAFIATSLVWVLPRVGLQRLMTPAALSLAMVIGLGSAYLLWQEIGGREFARIWLSSRTKA